MFFKKSGTKDITISEKVRDTFKNAPTLESDRLIYKRIVPENTQDMFDYSKLEEVTRYLLWTPHVSFTQTEKYIKLLQKKYDNGSFWDFGLTSKEDIATEAAKTVMRYCFENFGCRRICGKFMEGNNGSMRVMTKLGMTLEGIYRNSMYVKGEYKTIHVYEITRERFYELFGDASAQIRE